MFPVASTALAAVQDISRLAEEDALLAVDDPRPVRAGPLPNSEYEVHIAISAFPHHHVLKHEEATLGAVLKALPGYSVLHFSCHGSANFTEPLASKLIMANDETLTVRDLLDLHLTGARLAILSACETGIQGITLPDEVISLPTGVLQAGVAGVAASLWPMYDISTMMLMTRFYDLWRREGVQPPDALRRAQLWLRDTTNGEKLAYFERFLQGAFGSRMPSTAADMLHRRVKNILFDPDSRSFTHPFHWAAFGYTGI